jgi:hypothetical protein
MKQVMDMGCSGGRERQQYLGTVPCRFEEHRTVTDGSSMVAAATLIGDHTRERAFRECFHLNGALHEAV